MNNFIVDFERTELERLNVISDSVHMACKNVVEGDVAEFGIGQGNSFRVIAETLQLCEPYQARFQQPLKCLHGFDSFQGFPPATLEGDTDCPLVIHNVWGKPKISPGEYQIRNMVGKFLYGDRIFTYPGFFCDTLKNIRPGQTFCMVNIDCDMYVSTREVLEELFANKRLSDGCMILFDDFIENRASKKFGQRKAWEECKAKYSPELTDMGSYWIGGWRFIYHRDAK